MELENELIDNELTILITSHDRAFIDNVANRFLLIKNGRLEEVSSSNEYYNSLNEKVISNEKTLIKSHEKIHDDFIALSDEHEILYRITELEKNLADDLARKPKHQKLKNQEAWRQEIEKLYGMLEGS
ncbi:hypothetical protein [Xenorhabdus bovienii]|uniref:hypothetical protein n=1 Tax=Xenorhabdus bovienii TaxID=40576 RepID=UPI001E2E074E|nr:hypothetical protein [Xenorhabdus bovienii]